MCHILYRPLGYVTPLSVLFLSLFLYDMTLDLHYPIVAMCVFLFALLVIQGAKWMYGYRAHMDLQRRNREREREREEKQQGDRDREGKRLSVVEMGNTRSRRVSSSSSRILEPPGSGGGMNKTAVTFTATNSINSDDISDSTITDGDSSVINNPLVTNHP